MAFLVEKRGMFGTRPLLRRGLLHPGLSVCLSLASPMRMGFLLVGLLLATIGLPALAAETPLRLLDQPPFDRITLRGANGNEVIDTLLLDLPGRRLPKPLPSEGSLELRRLSNPSVLYTVAWNSIARVEFYEQLLLAEALVLTSLQSTEGRNLLEAYEYLNFLHNNYPQLAGLKLATEKYLRQDALAAYAKKNYEETLTILLALYDLNPQHRGLEKFVATITDRLIASHLAVSNFATARGVLNLLSSGFPQLRLTNIDRWRKKFEQGAARQLTFARQAVAENRYSKARQALLRALAILPEATGAAELLAEIDSKSPQIVVAVDQLVGPWARSQQETLHWSLARVAQLTQPTLLKITGFGAEGGSYRSPWAKLTSDDAGLQLDLQLNATALRAGITAERLALELLQQADPTQPQYRADFAGLLKSVAIDRGNLVRLHWQHSHVRPEALLSLTLRAVPPAAKPPGAYQASADKENTQLVTYRLPSDRLPSGEPQTGGPKIILEKFYADQEVAFADLFRGEVDVIARVPPWQVARWKNTEGIHVLPYRLPTIHVLLPNYAKPIPIMARREFRRALCYGIDRSQILHEILLGGERRPGFRLLSAPLPAGISLTDPVGYAYDQGLQPRAYQPRLAAVLATVARNSLTKMTDAKEKTGLPGEEPAEEQTASEPSAPLVLAHPPSAVATTACQMIKLQLDAIGIPVKLMVLTSQTTATRENYDLRYAELALWEPVVDARRLLGPHGLAGHCSSSMSLALQDVDQGKNWKEVRSRLQEVHQIAFHDLPVIPLWQTVEFYATRHSLRGLGKTPVTLYQNVSDWNRSVLPGGGS